MTQTYAWPRVSGPVDLYRIREYEYPSGAPGLVVDTDHACPILEIDPAEFSFEAWQLTVEAVGVDGHSGPASALSDIYTPVPEVGVVPGLLAVATALFVSHFWREVRRWVRRRPARASILLEVARRPTATVS